MNNILKGWQVKSLGEVFDIKQGKHLPLSDLNDGSYPVFGANGLVGNYNAFMYEDPTLLVTCRGATCGSINLTKPYSWVTGNAIALVPKEKIINSFFYFQLKNQSFKDVISGSAQPQIIVSTLSKKKIPLPPLPIQKQIAEILEQADKAKQKRKEANKLTDEFLQSVFIEMFGDPVKNPKGWEIVKVDDISSRVTSGSTPLGGDSNYLSEGILFIRSQNILMNKIDYSDMVFISAAIHKKMLRTWVKKNDVLFNITGASIGRVAYFEGEDDSANVNQHVCIIRTIKEKINHTFLSYLISSESFQSRVISQNAGATRQAFNFEQIKNFKVIRPPLSRQQQFAEIVNKTEALKEKQKQSEQELENLFQSLMQRAFKGELVS
jgi:type I restriction enzyme S subunit